MPCRAHGLRLSRGGNLPRTNPVQTRTLMGRMEDVSRGKAALCPNTPRRRAGKPRGLHPLRHPHCDTCRSCRCVLTACRCAERRHPVCRGDRTRGTSRQPRRSLKDSPQLRNLQPPPVSRAPLEPSTEDHAAEGEWASEGEWVSEGWLAATLGLSGRVRVDLRWVGGWVKWQGHRESACAWLRGRSE